MANPAKSNEPSTEDVQDAVQSIEKLFGDLLSERMSYMSRCKIIRKMVADKYEYAADQGISKKALKVLIKERDLERKIEALSDDLEADERNEYEMLSEKLGDFGTSPLGQAAMAKAGGKQTHMGV
jgi:hypothetical protein